MLKKILLADDLSKRAHHALELALDVSRKFSAELIILNVREDFLNKDEMIMLRVDVSRFQENLKEKALQIRQHIQQDIESLRGTDVSYSVLLREGKPAQQIVEMAKEISADLVVLGSHGRSLLKDKLLGSTAEEVVLKVRCHILVAWTRD
ncbi:MAG: universal stress protein [bacterium]